MSSSCDSGFRYKKAKQRVYFRFVSQKYCYLFDLIHAINAREEEREGEGGIIT